jgi:YD repeat-containing protein
MCRASVYGHLVLLAVLVLSIHAWADVRYVYDPLGRLVAVVDNDGGAAVYNYDAVGNLVSIQRIAPASPSVAVAITLVSPNHGVPGTTVQIFGKGFASSLGQNGVSFNGAPATVIAATPTALTVTVPSGASSGLISVTALLGSADSPTPFRVVGPVTVSPSSATLLFGTTQQFTANEGGVPTSSVRWSVNGVVGGNTTIGTISGSGVYTAPANAGGAPTTVTIAARHQDDPPSSVPRHSRSCSSGFPQQRT